MTFFNRSQEGPMEFEYQYQPFLYNSFDPPPKDQEMIDHPITSPSPSIDHQQSTLELNNVSNDLGGINLNEQKEPIEQIHRETQTEDLVTSQDTLLSSSPSTPPTTTVTSTSTSTNTENNDHSDHNDSPIQSNEQHAIPSIHQPHLHQHIYPPSHVPEYTYREHILFVASSFIRMGCDLAWFTMAIYVGIQFALALKRDVNLKLETFESDRLDEFLNCQMEYASNRCDPSTRVPAMDELCRQWQQCLYRPMWIGTTRAVAETLADIINGFIDKISIRTMFFILTIIILTLWTRTYTPVVKTITSPSLSPHNPNSPPGGYITSSEERKQIAWS
ncbi:Di-sulfide bridge nucleocytoplasmic transport domain-containing protein [Phascolomyces articulosus]|uniref:Di-sulfide bridge nucleocytoplasmic transport domain-containing protein n=1 Tax=Phascolomyces articulosus TaxID=60185 RepID=A0AAD5JNK9_9FUNG|nr:Di-sulfide bridge nucleocytoplasmic transport domain-containing protein [Phascolomyces articulosus]